MPGKASLIRSSAMALMIATFALADEGHKEARRLTESGEILPLDDILRSIKVEQAGRVLEVELERDDDLYLYEIEILDDRGAVWEFKVDATSGEILQRERED